MSVVNQGVKVVVLLESSATQCPHMDAPVGAQTSSSASHGLPQNEH
jgi:hypothetical protein